MSQAELAEAAYIQIEGEDGDLSLFEQKLFTQVRRLEPNDLRRLVAQARALADLAEGKGK